MTQSWQLLRERPGSAGYQSISTCTYALPDGMNGEWDVFGKDRSVAVVAITDASEVVLARQFRPGPGRVLDELPGGNVEDGEDVIKAAERELLEETGYAGQLTLAGTSWLASACRTQRFVAVAHRARQTAAPRNEPGEFCEVVLVTLPQFERICGLVNSQTLISATSHLTTSGSSSEP